MIIDTIRVSTLVLISFMLVGCKVLPDIIELDQNKQGSNEILEASPGTAADKTQDQLIDLALIHSSFQFALRVPDNWRAEYVTANQSINLYNSTEDGQSNLDKSQIFIRQFTANSFLTLSTVKIYSREVTTVGSRQAVRYDIEKKSSVANFSSQPAWRNQRHQLIDIRFSETSPSKFYVIAYSPTLAVVDFERIIDSIIFANDAT